MRLIATDDGQAVFEDPEIAAVATWEPMLSEIVANTSRKGSKVLLSSADFNGLGCVNTNEHGHAILFGWNSPKLNTNASRHTSRSNAAM